MYIYSMAERKSFNAAPGRYKPGKRKIKALKIDSDQPENNPLIRPKRTAVR